MSAFVTRLFLVQLKDSDPKYGGRATWAVVRPFIYQSDFLGKTITVPKGFVTDLGSVPRVPVAWYLAGGTDDQATVIHDYLYSSKLVDRVSADCVLREASAVLGQPMWRRNLMWGMVRLFGGSHYTGRPAPEAA